MRMFVKAALLMLSVIAQSAQSQDAKVNLFGAIHADFAQARKDKVDALAYRTFDKAASQLQDAEKDFDKGRKPEQVNEEVKRAQQLLNDAKQIAAVTRKELAAVVSGRDDALGADAPKYAHDAWQTADQRFRDAVDRIEKKDIEGARRKGSEAEVLLRDAELAGIKGNLLGEARGLIAQAEQSKTADFAPRTLSAAKRYLAQADQEITRNRYENATAKQLAAQAAYEAKHAIYLREQIAPLLQKDSIKQQGMEQVMLDWEEPIRRIATELNMDARFDQGYAPPMKDLYDKIVQQQREIGSLHQSVRDRDDQITTLDGEIRQLQSRLGGESQERIELQKRLSAQDRLRDNVARIEGMFSADEGRVFREGNSLTMSLTAISFRIGKSTIEPDAFPVLAKVGEALKLFPDATLVVEGHTDGQGNDSAMLLLSQDRADAVRQYLITNLGVNAEKVSAVGYGKQRPIASNDSESGRARNRRIDIVMKIAGN